MLNFMRIIIIVWFQSTAALVSQTPDFLYLSSFLKPSYEADAKDLSSSSIVEMMPTTTNARPLRQQLFASPLISNLYERILPPLWEMGLRIGGPDAEYTAAVEYLGTGAVALDLSCGTGFVGKRMALSGMYQHVFALDYSMEMLNECVASINRENNKSLPISIIRGDAGNLPFNDNVFDAVHWGAAMHCVPDVAQAMKEVHRVIKPGGKLYATTFLRPFPDVVFRFFTLQDIQQLGQNAGFMNVDVEGRGVYGILRSENK
eukprot:CAMPEP_0194250244 /NCGR_PEP_ID=MMETSP0158-20130606/22512_1 /TAXON_ID=33649 /ORGANISM="Thalassionema nitzschioides, Strain L26-B" /LENGTH=259 /DNA_ID=CAMNT_0038986979 /DNA_START=1 /DNA_END=778 /DNA_ORIENTATION=-